MKKQNKIALIFGVPICIAALFDIHSDAKVLDEALVSRELNYSSYVDKSCVLDYTNIIGDVSDETVSEFVSIVETQVPQAAFNFLVNSGGSILIVEGNNVADYTSGDKVAYYPEGWYVAGSTQVDYLTSIKDYQVVTSASIILAADKIDSTLHEFMHVLDCCLGYEHRSDEFQQIHYDIDSYHVFDVLMQDFSQDYKSQDYYYLGSSYESFAEIMARYVEGSITDERLQGYCRGVLDRI